MSVARPLSSLLSAGAVVALTLAAPGTALADPGQGPGPKQGHGEAASGGQGKAQKGEPAPASADRAAEDEQGSSTPARKPAAPAQGKPGKPAAQDMPAKPTKPTKDEPAPKPTAASADDAAQGGSGDPAGNNGTIKVDTVPGDPDRANRPHPGCSFVVQFFGFDADQHADITFTGQAPTASSGPLLTLDGRLISTSPADGALEEGHSLVLSAADLGLVGTPTAAKGWHVKVAVDALEAPGGAKQKVFWLDCASGEAAVEQEDDAAVSPAGAAEELAAPTVVEQSTTDRRLEGFGDDVAVLSGSADRAVAADREVTAQERVADVAAVRAEDAAQGRSTTSTLASVLPFAVPAALPFTGAAGVTGMLVAGLGAVAAGALALRAGRRRTTG